MAGPRWLFNREQFSNTPSIKAGLTEEKESSIRQQAAHVIQNMGQHLHLNQLCMNTAIVYMHRFYMFHSLQKFSFKRMASAFIFLAAKVEEQPKKIEYVIKTYYFFNHKGEDGRPVADVDIRSQDYLEKVQELVINENILLQTLGFNVTIDHSNTHVVKLCQLVKAPKELSQLSYFLSTNSLLLTNMCLQFSSEVIAAICIHLACKWSDWQLKRSKENKDWWQYVVPTLTGEKLEEISKRFLSVMEKADPKLKRQLLSRLRMPSDSSPNSRSSSPAPFPGGRSSHGTPHRPSSQGHSSHSTFTPERAHSSKPAPAAAARPDVPPAQTYAEHKERARTAAATSTDSGSSKSKPYQAESALSKTEPKPYHTEALRIKTETKPYHTEAPRIKTETKPYHTEAPRIKTETKPHHTEAPRIKTETKPHHTEAPRIKTETKPYHTEAPRIKTDTKPFHTEAPRIKGDMKRPYPKESHSLHSSSTMGSSGMTNKIKIQDPALPHQSQTAPSSHNPYNKPPRNHDSSRSRHHHRPHMGQTVDHSPHKKPRIAGENGNGEQRPPLPPQPPLPRPPPPP